MNKKCEHKISIPIQERPAYGVSICTSGCQEIVITTIGEDGVKKAWPVSDLLTMATEWAWALPIAQAQAILHKEEWSVRVGETRVDYEAIITPTHIKLTSKTVYTGCFPEIEVSREVSTFHIGESPGNILPIDPVSARALLEKLIDGTWCPFDEAYDYDLEDLP